MPHSSTSSPVPGDHPLVLLHGFTGAGSAWRGVSERLTRRGHAPATPDLPGHGRRVGETDFGLPEAYEAIERASAGPVDLAGYSMGGRIALHFALARPAAVRRLVLESASPGLATGKERSQRREDDAGLAERIVREGVEAFVDSWEKLPLFATQSVSPPERLEEQRERRLRNDARSLAAALTGLGTGSLPSLWGRLAEVGQRTLLLVGAEDRKFVSIAGRMAELLPDVELGVVPGCGHAVHFEKPEAWVERVGDFLAAP